MNNMERILKGLLKRTEEGQLKWRTTVNENRFVASIDTIGVSVQLLRQAMQFTPDSYRLEVLNDEGATVDSLETLEVRAETREQLDTMRENNRDVSRLFTLARRSALDTDATLEKLANSLENFQ